MADVTIDRAEFEAQIDAILRDIVDEIFTESQKNIVKMGISNEGFLLKSGDVVKKDIAHYQIIYSAPYAEYVEFGSEPHMPPVEPILKWVRTKLRVTNEKQARKTAWAIAKGIAKQGIQPKPFLRNALDRVTK